MPSHSVSPDDRVLVIGFAGQNLIDQLARALGQGSLVVVGQYEDVLAARRQFAALDNVMFTVGSRDDIPWRSQTFTLILDANPDAPSAEMTRVLHPSGRIISERDGLT